MRPAASSLALGALATGALVLGGCPVGPNYSAPELHLPAGFSRAEGAGGSAGDLSQFWQRFDDPLLTQLVELALFRSPDLDAAWARLLQARARRGLAGAELFPTLGYSADISRTRSIAGGFPGASTAGAAQSSGFTRSLYGAGFDASWEIDLFGGRRRALEAAQADEEATAAELAATQVSLVAEVALNYVEVRSFQARLEVARRNLESQSETLQIVEWRALAGLVTELDVEEARRALETTRATIPPLELGLAEAEHRIAILLGLAPGALLDRLAAARPIPSVPERVLVGIPAETLSRRPDVRAAERRIAAETARIGEAEARQYPTLTLSGSIGLDALVGSTPGLVYSLLAGLSGPLLDAGRIRSQVELQRAVTAEALAAYRSAVLTALEDVENALVSVEASRDRRAALDDARDAADSAVQLARLQYESGLIDFQPVLDAQRSLLVVEDALVTTRAETTSNVIRLYKALGGGWSPSGATATGGT